MKHIALILLLLWLVVGCDTTSHSANGNAVPYDGFLVYPIEKIRPHQKIDQNTQDKTTVLIAGFEREPFIVGICNNGSSPLSIGSLRIGNSNIETTLNTALYKIDYVSVEDPTWIGRTAAKGFWPDPLIPVEEREDRFILPAPIQIPPGENRAFLVDLFRPKFDFAPGELSIRAATEESLYIELFSTAGQELTRLEVNILLLPFSLPDTPSLTTAFGFDWTFVSQYHHKYSSLPVDEESLHLDYLHVLAANRVSIHWPAYQPVLARETSSQGVAVDWLPFEDATGKLLDGKLFDDVTKATSFRFPMFADRAGLLTDDEFISIAAQYVAQKGWDDKAFYYLPDEPLRREYPRVIEVAENAATFSPGIRRLVTEPFSAVLEGSVEIWCPDVISIGDTIPLVPFYYKYGKLNADWQVNRYPSIYVKRKSENEESWFYTCTSAQIGKYPNLFVDYDISYHRVIPWIAYRYGFSGILHWATTASYHLGSRNPWIDQFHYRANGDGNLLYPGTPEMTGVQSHFAVPSLRLIAFREGSEDFEYLTLLSKVLDESQAKELVLKLVKTSVRWERSASAYGELKAHIAELLSGAIMH